MEKPIQFSKEMLLGVGSSAYQIEGAWESEGKTPSIQDQYFHSRTFPLTENVPKRFLSLISTYFLRGTNICRDESLERQIINGDIACNSYNKVDEDIKNLVELGVDVYRFSISWPRILPKGDFSEPNELGITHYKNFIKKLLANNIQPLVTIFHWDLPNNLQKIGGWASPLMIEYFAAYATFLFKTFGDEVKLWTTINEPGIFSMGYGSDFAAPGCGNEFSGINDYAVWRNLLLGHAAAYKIYNNSFKAKQKGEISIAIDAASYFPANPHSEADREACLKGYDYAMGVFIQPLVTGEFPKSVLDAIEKTNKSIKFPMKRLVPFTDEEKEVLIGSYDFIAFNYYASQMATGMTKEAYDKEKNLKVKDMGYTREDCKDMKMNFKGFSEVIDWLMKTCNNPTLFIAENGISGTFNDDDQEKKIKYHHGILSELNKAIKNGVNIKGYTMWSFMDSLEWPNGYYKNLYGIYAVDFNDPERPRSKKPCFEFFRQLFKTKKLPSIEQSYKNYY